ncbi:sulfatase-like hydrolase/transferase [Paraburkholderia kirstenboschensis]|uniref:Sulfatase-like hydrolase/transferase n=1 Tax=Paraburkholderia kirstenboschensis TaxID=1245436 RepID=A0ABZ0E8A5_9BURK|nr:sulfatase-like hydrolase/transferase [Paraburkholderia kirstenboschensis]WOD13467.1 sulfatase-like hydrolase/transferase [Paraburkholderia kirstenboschensis]
MDRREFIKKTSAVGAAVATADVTAQGADAAQGGDSSRRKPNILFILLDEMRFPSVFPDGITDVRGFLKTYMPRTFDLWRKGVKFSGHYTAASACSPARATLVTGLYTQQNWLLTTILDAPDTKVSTQPVLRREYPTYGKILQSLGYLTPYIGKWHLSIVHKGPRPLSLYGFEAMTYPDPTGSNLQGTIGDPGEGYLSDSNIADQASQWLQGRKPGDSPWCLTVGFINPHDKEFFPAGTEFKRFTALFNSNRYNPNGYTQWINYTKGPPSYNWEFNPLRNPPPLAYPATAPNWESGFQLAANKPPMQTFNRTIQEAVWGGVQDTRDTDFEITAYPANPNYPPPSETRGIAKAPFHYWKRGLDSYTQIMSIVDGKIGAVVDALPHAVARNTIIILTSDHGDYAGAHGLISGKTGTCYEEAFNVPLIVVDPTGQYAGDIDTVRGGLTSSVDILPLLATIGNGGQRNWLTGDYAQMYGKRHDLLPMLKSSSAPGRPYVVFSTDETVPESLNFNNAASHIVAVRTDKDKLGAYSHWAPSTTTVTGSSDLEYYDYSTERGRLELDNRHGDPAAQALHDRLISDIVPNELQAPLPGSLVAAQNLAQARYLEYVQLINSGGDFELPFRIGDV